MKTKEEIEKIKKEIEEKPNKYYNAVKVQCKRILLELGGKQNMEVLRIRQETDLGDITFKPKRKVEEKKEIAGFETITGKSEFLTVEEFKNEFPVFVKIAEEVKKAPQEVWISYVEMSSYNEKEDEEVQYRYMLPFQVETIYYEKLHGKDKTNLEKQEERKKKYLEEEL